VPHSSQPRVLLLLGALLCTQLAAKPAWVVDPGNPGQDLPPVGRSLFDHLTSDGNSQVVPFPFEALVARIRATLDSQNAYLDDPVKQVLIPLGRSLQRSAAAPDFFASPRLVLAVDGEPRVDADKSLLLRDRLFIGYLAAADVLEVISYNEDAARFEFQIVHDYAQGQAPRVRYARRVVCMACHQNAAPIFARPLWDETNANRRLNKHFPDTKRIHGVEVNGNIDTAYAIDNATDRANQLALTQTLWQQGCGGGVAGRQCRASLLTSAVQYGLSGRRGFTATHGNGPHGLQARMQLVRKQLWPDGLLLPDADLPNRRPLLGASLISVGDIPSERWELMADIPADLEPLRPRPAQSHWSPDAAGWVERAVKGLSGFLAASDLQWMDLYLADAEARVERWSIDCKIRNTTKSGARALRIDCSDGDTSIRASLHRPDTDGQFDGRVGQLQIRGEQLGSLTLRGRQASENHLRFEVFRRDAVHSVRLHNGNAVGSFELELTGGAATQARLGIRLRHDFEVLRLAVSKMAGEDEAGLEPGPFRRAAVLNALRSQLGLEPIPLCCSNQDITSVAQTDPISSPPPDPLLDSFNRVCSACHRSESTFPPNFLAGPPERAMRRIAQCAERIAFRLAMWDLKPGERAKTPMPPQHIHYVDDEDHNEWRDRLLPQLRAALRTIAGTGLAPDADIITQPYATLRPCVSHT